jgi:hypothetical protein
LSKQKELEKLPFTPDPLRRKEEDPALRELSVVTQNRPMRKPGTLTPTGALIGSFGMSNVLREAKKLQVLALGKLGWYKSGI